MKIVEWNEYCELLGILYKSVMNEGFDSVAAIGRGGSIMAGYLTSKLGVPEFVPLFVRHEVTAGDVKEIRCSNATRCDLSSLIGKVLVVDDLLIEGTAMEYVLGLLPKGTSARTIVMYCRKGAEFKPDFAASYLDENEQHVLFPYDLP